MKDFTANKYRNDDNKVLISFNYAFNKMLSQLTIKDFNENGLTYRCNRFFTDDILHTYYTILDAYRNVATTERRRITIFEKAMCLGMAIRKFKTFEVITKDDVVPHLADINERFISEVLIALLHYSEYDVKKNGKFAIEPSCMNFEVAFSSNNSKLEALKSELTELIKSEGYSAENVLNTLKKLFILSVLYSNGLDENDFDLIKDSLKIKESSKAPALIIKHSTLLKELKADRDTKYVHC